MKTRCTLLRHLMFNNLVTASVLKLKFIMIASKSMSKSQETLTNTRSVFPHFDTFFVPTVKLLMTILNANISLEKSWTLSTEINACLERVKCAIDQALTCTRHFKILN